MLVEALDVSASTVRKTLDQPAGLPLCIRTIRAGLVDQRPEVVLIHAAMIGCSALWRKSVTLAPVVKRLVPTLLALFLAVSGMAQDAENTAEDPVELFVSPGAPDLAEGVPEDLQLVLSERVPNAGCTTHPTTIHFNLRAGDVACRAAVEPKAAIETIAAGLDASPNRPATRQRWRKGLDSVTDTRRATSCTNVLSTSGCKPSPHLDDSRRLEFPVPDGHMGRGFGRTRRGSLRNRRHNGVDIGAPEGNPIVAARDGLVMYSNNEITGYGNVVILLHHEGYSTFYAHCSATHVFPGQFVRRGQQIASIGDTGFAWAPHLHFEWRQRGWVRDPEPHFIRERERRRRARQQRGESQ